MWRVGHAVSGSSRLGRLPGWAGQVGPLAPTLLATLSTCNCAPQHVSLCTALQQAYQTVRPPESGPNMGWVHRMSTSGGSTRSSRRCGQGQQWGGAGMGRLRSINRNAPGSLGLLLAQNSRVHCGMRHCGASVSLGCVCDRH